MTPRERIATPGTSLRSAVAWCRIRLELLIWRHGAIWMVAVAMLLAAACIRALWLPALRAANTDAQAKLDRPAGPRQSVASPSNAQPDTALASLEALDRVLPLPAETAAQVRNVYRIAARQGLAVSHGAFQQSKESQLGIEQLQINLSLNGSYAQLRRFIEEVLRELPNASLGHLSLKRSQVAQVQLEARLRLSIWMKRGDLLPAEAPVDRLRPEVQP